MKRRRISTQTQIDELRKAINDNSVTAHKDIEQLFGHFGPAEVLTLLKFREVGREPLSGKVINFIEQVNQTATYLASLDALELLRQRHPDVEEWIVNLGTQGGFDIESADHSILAEVFAAVDLTNNKKLTKDREKLSSTNALHKYVVYRSPTKERYESTVGGITEISLGMPRQGT